MTTYIDWLSPEAFKACLQHVCESQQKHTGNKTKTQIQMMNYLRYLDGNYKKEDLLSSGFFSVQDLISLKVHGFIIDIYMRMVKDLTGELYE